MRLAIILSLLLSVSYADPPLLWYGAPVGNAGADTSCGTNCKQIVSDSIAAHGLGPDSSAQFNTLRVTDSVGFNGGPARGPCFTYVDIVPNPVTNTQDFLLYQQSVQDCLDDDHYKLIQEP